MSGSKRRMQAPAGSPAGSGLGTAAAPGAAGPGSAAAPAPAGPAPGAAAAAWSWRQELRGAGNATAAMLPFVLSYGFIALGALGAAATAAGLTASVTSVVLGGLLLVLLSRATLPGASPSASSCLIVAGGVAVWARDPLLDPATPAGLAGILALLGLSVMGAGALQVAMGLLRAGRLVRFVPQPVLAGFMNGVAVLIALSQLAPALGIDPARLAREGWAALAAWQPAALLVAAATAGLMAASQRLLPRWPSALVALVLAGSVVAGLQAALGGAAPAADAGQAGLAQGLAGLRLIGEVQLGWPWPPALAPLLGDGGWALLHRHGSSLLATAALLAIIGALESVLNLAAVDQQARSRSDPDRTLVALGVVNLVLGSCAGLPVIYLRLRALATWAAGGRTARALVLGSALLALVFTLGLPLLAHCPKAVVAGVVIMLAWRLVDPWTLALLQRRGTAPQEVGSVTDRRLSLAVVSAVCGVTVVWGFVAGVALGVLLSSVLLVRALNRSLVRQRHSAAEIPSRRVYPAALEPLLVQLRPRIRVLELEGALFFGNVDRLEREVRALLANGSHAAALHTLVLDLRRVSTVDASGAVMLQRLRELLAERGQRLSLAGVSLDNRHGASLRAHHVIGHGAADDDAWALHPDADRATEAAERAALAAAGAPLESTQLPLQQCALFAGLDADGFACVAARLQTRQLQPGERLFAQGDPGDALYVLSAGSVSVVDRTRRQRFVSFSPGMTFGEMALLDGGGRTADAVADTASTVHALDAAAMAALEREAPAVAAQLFRNLSLHLAVRLREASGAWRRAAG